MPKNTKRPIAKSQEGCDEVLPGMHQQADDVFDLQSFDKRAKERSRPFKKVLKDLKHDGLLQPGH